MSVRIQLDPPRTFYTNLDFISGRIILSLTSEENVTAIMVKLEGESRTVLMRPVAPYQQVQPYNRQPQQRQGLAVENHKLLYKVTQVFPTSNTGMGGGSYTLRPGQHEYPFQFKIPFNNGCADPHSQGMGPGSGFGGFGLAGLQQMQYKHARQTLPPSLTGFPGEAEIRYYVKVTVQRPSLFKENRRSAIGFKFMPIEPPRPPPSDNEVFARRQFGFQGGGVAPTAKQSKGFFTKKRTPLSDTPPKGEVDARLPSPAILTCNEPLPLRLIVRRTTESPEYIFLVSLQVTLIGETEVRAQDVLRTETSQWPVINLTGLAVQIGKPTDPVKTEHAVDKSLWERICLPNTVAPSFHTCNLTRKYVLEVKIGLGYGAAIGQIQPQTILLPLYFPVQIYSGISPPPALLDAMAAAPPITAPSAPVRPSSFPSSSSATQPAHDPLYPPQLPPQGLRPEDDAPPSYEDAMADDITPVDGPRRDFSGVTDENAPGLDEKAAPAYSGRFSEGGSGSGSGFGSGVGRNAVV